jgi:hypothetical protein
MHEAQRSASQTMLSFICCSLTMSAIASRPPGFSTREDELLFRATIRQALSQLS